MLQVKIAGVGAFAPPTGTRNAELEERLGLELGWIEQRTGVGFRPIAEPSVATSDLAVEAGARALQAASIAPAEIGLLLLATSTPDHLLPPTAPLVAHRLGLTQAGAIDLAGACSGFLYGLILASSHARAFFSQRHFVWIAPARGSCKKGEIPEEPGACLWMPGGETLVSII